MSNTRSSVTARRLRTVALATAGSCLVGLIAALQAPAATAAGETEMADTSVPEGWSTQSYDEVAVAARKAKETGQRVELESRRGTNVTEFVNPDGTSTVEITQHDTRVEKNGEFVDIDPSLDDQGDVLVPEASAADVEITDGSGAEPLATVSSGSKSLSLDWTTTDLSTARVDGAEATFDAGSNRDVRVTATAEGFNVNIVLDKVPATAPVYRLPVTAKGVRLVATTGGGFAAEDANGNVVFRIAPPLMWDSSQTTVEAGPEHTVPVEARVVDAADGGQVLELRPDWAWMSDPARVLPIFVDPDVYVDDEGQQGTYVAAATPNTAYPTSSMNRVGYSTAYGKTRTYWQPNLPARVGGRVVSASLRLYEYDAHSCTKTPVTIYPIGSYWDANTATWNNRPESLTTSPYRFTTQAFAHGVDGTGGCANNFETIEGNPTSNPDAMRDLVEAWMNYTPDDPFTPNVNEQVGLPYFGMTLMGSDTDPATYKGFCSYVVNPNGTSCFESNPVRQPTLTITYNTPPTKAFDTRQSPVTCYDGDAPRVTSLTPTLRATADDVDVWHRNAGEWLPTDDGQENVRLKFEVWPQRAVNYSDPNVVPADDPDGPLAMTATGYSSYVQRNTAATWTLPAAKLIDGEEYVWRAIADDGTDTSPYWSDWKLFRVNTAEAPGIDCPVRVLDAATAESAATVLDGLVESTPSLYATSNFDPATGRVQLVAARVAGQADATTIANARDQASGALYSASTLTPAQAEASFAALVVTAVNYSKSVLDAVVDDLSAKSEANDPAMATVTGFGVDYMTNLVTVSVDPLTTDATNYFATQYGDKVVAVHRPAGEDTLGPFDAGFTRYGGMALRIAHADGTVSGCSSSVAVKKTDGTARRFLLTAGHCAKALNEEVRNFNKARNNSNGQYLGTFAGRINSTTMDAGLVSGDYSARAWTGERDGSESTPAGFGNKSRAVGMSATKDPLFGQLCMWGTTTGNRCGFIIKNDNYTTPNTDREVGYRRGLVLAHDNRPGPGVAKGDSGGMVYTVIQEGPRAGQIHVVGVVQGAENGGEYLRYYPIRVINGRFGVTPVISPN